MGGVERLLETDSARRSKRVATRGCAACTGIHALKSRESRTEMLPKSVHRSLFALLSFVVLAACGDGGGSTDTGQITREELFRRYVAVGNSITAGVQSDGLNDSTQAQGSPVLLAQQAGTAFSDSLGCKDPGVPRPSWDRSGSLRQGWEAGARLRAPGSRLRAQTRVSQYRVSRSPTRCGPSRGSAYNEQLDCP